MMQHIHRNQEVFFDKNGMHYSASPLFGLKLANDFFLHQFFETWYFAEILKRERDSG